MRGLGGPRGGGAAAAETFAVGDVVEANYGGVGPLVSWQNCFVLTREL